MNKGKKLRSSENRKSFSKESLDEISNTAIVLASSIKNEQESTQEVTMPEINYGIADTSVDKSGSKHYALCCCCLELPCPKSMWTPYSWMGHTELYGEMLKECFGLVLPEELISKGHICEVCITRLRDSLRFRRQVVECHATLSHRLGSVAPDVTVKVEPFTEDCDTPLEDELEKPSKEVSGLESPKMDEADDLDIDSVQEPTPPQNKSTQKKRKISKDRKPLKPGIKKDRRRGPRTDHIRPRQNIGLLLQHTTILPFKSNKGYFNCFYCNKQFVVVEELRKHVDESHNNVSFLSIIKNILRPHDRIKVDVSSIICRICSKACTGIEETVTHLEGHEIKFNYEDKLLKPTDCLLCYDLSQGKFKCVVCNAEFHFFKTLTKHMNEHSTNHVCDVCGKCFLLGERLKAHTQVHELNAAVNCDVCGKLCATAGRLRSHKRHHHKKRSHMCGICNESFPTFRQRMLHLEEMHHRSPLDLNCKICLRSFKTTSHLGCHMRTEHYNIPYVRKRKKVDK